MIWWEQWELTHSNSLLIPNLENLSGTVLSSHGHQKNVQKYMNGLSDLIVSHATNFE